MKIMPTVHLTVDIVLFNIINNKLHVLLVQRKTAPFEGSFCLPGGFVKDDLTVEETVVKVLFRETGVFCDHIHPFKPFSSPNRDPRGRVVSIGCYAIVSNESIKTKAGQNQWSASFYPIDEIELLGFDHVYILKSAYHQLQKDVQTSDIVKYFLPKLFTLDQLKKSCEVIYNRPFEKRNFVKYVESHFKIRKTNKKEFDVSHRPASYYKFVTI